MKINNQVADETEEHDVSEKKYFSCFEYTLTQKQYHIYLSSIIEEPAKYVDLIHLIKAAGEDDVIYIYFNCPGGDLLTGVQIINAMNTSAAHIIGVLESSAIS